jgi:hypothetical protein
MKVNVLIAFAKYLKTVLADKWIASVEYPKLMLADAPLCQVLTSFGE